MKRLVSACLLLALVVLLAAPNSDAAVNIKIKRVALALNDLPAGTSYAIRNGLRVVGKGSTLTLTVDTLGTGQTGTAAWTFDGKPTGSAAAFDNAANFKVTFVADTVGFYYVSVTYGSQTAKDTIYASTYKGIADPFTTGCFCHPAGTAQSNAYADWKNTGHAQIFKMGITGNLEDEADPTTGKIFGAYAPTCVKCHTTGWDPTLSNNNFGYSVKQTGWDTTWFKGLPLAGGDYWIQKDDSTKWNMLTAEQKSLGSISCENCHGPLAGHTTGGNAGNFKQTVAVTLDAGVCNQCHNASKKHSLGGAFNRSVHALVPNAVGHTDVANCQPCHTGAGFVYFMNHGKDTTGIAAAWPTIKNQGYPISCQVCHDPHKASTINPDGSMDPGLRPVAMDSLRNGFKFAAKGASQICSFCHRSRYSVTSKVKPNDPNGYYGFSSRFSPHENPQFDMFVGGNAYQFGDTTFSGVNTHGGLEDGCVTCHMQPQSNGLASHTFSMTDTTGGFKPTTVCANCHGEITEFGEVKAFYDFDRNGKIEGVQTEIQGLLDQLKAILPKDNTGEVIGGGTVTAADSAKIKGRLDLVAGIYNYRFVIADKSMGVHNAQYAARLLYKSLGWTPLWVKEVAGPVPTEYALNQNYPNPFNPSTVIRFSLPKEERVSLQVFDVTGKVVKTLLNEAVRAGNKEVTWDGTNVTGAKVASGIYFYRLQAGSFVATKKMIMLK